MSSTQHVGSAGQLALMAEFAYRGYNVSIPEIDQGDDAWVMNHHSGHAWRFQVKTSTPMPQKKSIRFQFNVRQSQISHALQPDVVFALVMRVEQNWKYLIIHRSVLQNYLAGSQLGKQSGSNYVISVSYYHQGPKAGQIWATKTLNLTHHLGDWSTWPEI